MWITITAIKETDQREEVLYSKSATSMTEVVESLIKAAIKAISNYPTTIIIKGDWNNLEEGK